MTTLGLDQPDEAFELFMQVATLGHPDPSGITWSTDAYRDHPLTWWPELGRLLFSVGHDGYEFLIVNHARRQRFIQARGDAEGMIIEVCADGRMSHPIFHRLRRATSLQLPHARLMTLLWEGDGVHPGDLFTAAEAVEIFERWLTSGSVPAGLELIGVAY